MQYNIQKTPYRGSLQIGCNIDIKVIIQYQPQHANCYNNCNGVAQKPYDDIGILEHIVQDLHNKTAKNCHYNEKINTCHILHVIPPRLFKISLQLF